MYILWTPQDNAPALTDSSDSTHRSRPQPSTSNGPRPAVLANKDDPIVITSSSEDDRTPAVSPTQRRNSGTQRRGANRKGPPPGDVEVISISDSDGDVCTRSAGLGHPTVPAFESTFHRLFLKQRQLRRHHYLNLRQHEHLYLTAPPVPLVSTSTQLPQHSPSRSQDTRQQDSELTTQPTPPSYVPRPDDFVNAFGDMDLDTPDDDNASGALDG